MSTEFCATFGGIEKKFLHFNSGTMCTYVVIVPFRPQIQLDMLKARARNYLDSVGGRKICGP